VIGGCIVNQDCTRGVRCSRTLVNAAVIVRRRWTPLRKVVLQLASRFLTATTVFRDSGGGGASCGFLAAGVCGYEYYSDG